MLGVQKPQKQCSMAEQRRDQRHHQCPGSLENANAFLNLCHEYYYFFPTKVLFLSGVGLCCSENSSREVVFFIGFAGN